MKFSKKVLPNGLRLITVPMKDNPTVTVLVMVEAGSKYETKSITGLSHFIEHVCFKGTKKRPTALDISQELDSIGAHYNAFTAQEFTGYYAKSEAKHFSKILDVVSDLYLNPVFDPIEIEKEKGVIIEEINMYEDLPHRHVQDLFMELLYGDTPAGWNIAGTREAVRDMHRDDFILYRDRHYVAPATAVIVAGNIEALDIEGEVKKAFAGISAGEKHKKTHVKEFQDKPELLVHYKKTDQAHLVVGVRAFDTYHEKQPVLKVIETILGGGMSSRLFQKLREEMGVGYYVRANEDSYTDHGLFQVATGVDIKRVPEVIKAVLNELNRLKTEMVTEEELMKIKEYTAGSMSLGLESSDSIAEFFGYQEILRKNLRLPQEMLERIRAVTAEDINILANELFQDKNLNLAIIGPYQSTESFEKILHF